MNLANDVSVILVGINSREYLSVCLRSLEQTEWHGYTHETVYVDNASADGSVEMVRSEFPGVRVIVNSSNLGFCAACNQAAELSNSRYLYLLNNDTKLYPDSIPLLVEFLDRTPRAVAAGNRLLNPDLTDQWSARRFPKPLNALLGRRSMLSRIFPTAAPVRDYLYKDQWSREEPFEADWVPGSCTLVRSDAYQVVGGLPEGMHYWSDAVFCDRLHRAGGDIYVVPEAKLIHYEGHGTGRKSAPVRRWLIADFHRGAYQFYCEHYSLSVWNPARWIARAALSARAGVLIAADTLRGTVESIPTGGA